MLNRLDNICAVLGAANNFRRKFDAFLAHLIDLVYYVFHRRAMDDNAIGSLAEGAKHGRNTEAQHETNESGEPGYIEEGP